MPPLIRLLPPFVFLAIAIHQHDNAEIIFRSVVIIYRTWQLFWG